MSSELRKARKEIVDLLNDRGIRAYGYNSKDIIPPIVLVLPSSRYVRTARADQTMNSWPVGFTLLVVGGNVDEPSTLDALDDYLEGTLVALAESGFAPSISDVSDPVWLDLKIGRAVGVQLDMEILVGYNRTTD